MKKSKWHVIYWLKWYFIVKPEVERRISKAKAEMVNSILNGDVLRDRLDKR